LKQGFLSKVAIYCWDDKKSVDFLVLWLQILLKYCTSSHATKINSYFDKKKNLKTTTFFDFSSCFCAVDLLTVKQIDRFGQKLDVKTTLVKKIGMKPNQISPAAINVYWRADWESCK
jgi:hypothetical protein